MDINDAKTRINDLEIKIKNLKEDNELLAKKNSKLKKLAIASAIVAICGWFSPYTIITILALLFELAVVLPVGVICYNNEDKSKKNEKDVGAYKQEIIMLEKYVEKLTNEENIEPIASTAPKQESNKSVEAPKVSPQTSIKR